uniref:FCP1 homology domain-containing protein n=1 Tax=viral metagenome TaxID=1070528 RepID=A0A6C0KFC5_9ZZZZ
MKSVRKIKQTPISKRSVKRRKTKVVKKKNDLLIVFDIDETLIQFLHAKNSKDAVKLWKETDENVKAKLHYVTEKKHVIILRPHLRQLFNYCMKNANIRVGLWTLSEREYGKSIAHLLSAEFNLPENFFLFVYGDEDVKDYKTRKDLSMIWDKFPTYHHSNTFLVDDLKQNIMHPINRKNGFLTPAFAPFGMKGHRDDIVIDESIANALEDDAMKEVVKFSRKIIRYNTSHAEDRRPLFDKKRMADMKMQSYLKMVAKDEPELIRVASYGRPTISM